MSFRVVWARDALADYWEIWTSSANKSDISEAVTLLEQDLARNPLSSRYEIVGGLGAAIRSPVGVDFFVDLHLRTVTVSAVWLAE